MTWLQPWQHLRYWISSKIANSIQEKYCIVPMPILKNNNSTKKKMKNTNHISTNLRRRKQISWAFAEILHFDWAVENRFDDLEKHINIQKVVTWWPEKLNQWNLCQTMYHCNSCQFSMFKQKDLIITKLLASLDFEWKTVWNKGSNLKKCNAMNSCQKPMELKQKSCHLLIYQLAKFLHQNQKRNIENKPPICL